LLGWNPNIAWTPVPIFIKLGKNILPHKASQRRTS
jgi:hypothetical protein